MDGTHPITVDADTAMKAAEAALAARCALCGHHRSTHPDDGPCTIAACADRCTGYQRKQP